MTIVILALSPCEYFCYSCGHFRLWMRDDKPVACTNCNSPSILIGEVNSLDVEVLRAQYKDTHS